MLERCGNRFSDSFEREVDYRVLHFNESHLFQTRYNAASPPFRPR
jgi:hypothetical protein